MARRIFDKFSKQLQQLRLEKGVTARDMSRALGLTDNYIFNIEAGYAYPSMANFFAICEYFGITPSAFLQFEPETTAKQDDLLFAAKGLGDEEMDALIAFAKELHAKNLQ